MGRERRVDRTEWQCRIAGYGRGSMTAEVPPPDGLFRTATAVEPLDPLVATGENPGTNSRWRGAIAEGWDIAGNANGGYLLAITARAMSAALGRPDPVTVTAHYLSPGKPGPVSVSVEIAKQGRTFGTATATLASGERSLLRVLGTFGELTENAGPQLVDLEPPPMRSPSSAPPMPFRRRCSTPTCRWPGRRPSSSRPTCAIDLSPAGFAVDLPPTS